MGASVKTKNLKTKRHWLAGGTTERSRLYAILMLASQQWQ
jgi:hypothetical protein